jgi:hypothetical protein
MKLMERLVLTSHKLILLATMKRQMRSQKVLAKAVVMMTTPSQMALMVAVTAETTWFAGILRVRAVHRQTGGLHPQMQPPLSVTGNLLVCSTSHVTHLKILSLTAPR